MLVGLVNQKLMPWLFGSTCNHPFLIRILRRLAPCNKSFIYTVARLSGTINSPSLHTLRNSR